VLPAQELVLRLPLLPMPPEVLPEVTHLQQHLLLRQHRHQLQSPHYQQPQQQCLRHQQQQ
jgi:hypothetical protein